MFPGLGRRRVRTEQTSNLRRQHPFVARFPAHRVADATLGAAKTVIGCGVDIAHPGRPGGVHDGFGFAAADLDATTPEGRAAETQRRDFERGPSDPALLENRHRAISHSPHMSCGADHTLRYEKLRLTPTLSLFGRSEALPGHQ